MKHLLFYLLLACCLILPSTWAEDLAIKLCYTEDAQELAQLLRLDELKDLSLAAQHEILCEQSCSADSPETIELLLAAGLRPNPQDEVNDILCNLYANDKLEDACLLPLTKKLRAHGVVLSDRAFFVACTRLHQELMTYCLEQGVQVDEGRRMTPLTGCCFRSLTHYVDDLDDDASAADLAEAERQQAIANEKQLDCVRFLLAQGASVNGRQGDFCYPLHIACARGNVALAELLLLHGADVNHLSGDGITPLFDACSYLSNAETVDLLLKHGARVNQVSKSGMPPLMVAIYSQRGDAVESLLAHGADARVWYSLKNLNIEQYPDIPLPSFAWAIVGMMEPFYGDYSCAWGNGWTLFCAQSIWVQLATLLLLLVVIALPLLSLWAVLRLLRWLWRKCWRSSELNQESKLVIEETEKGINCASFSSTEELFKDLEK